MKTARVPSAHLRLTTFLVTATLTACARSSVVEVIGDTATDASVDADGDGSPRGEDCDDSREDVSPAVQTDGCDDVDNDCDGATDEDPDLVWFADVDDDGFGDPATIGPAGCSAPTGWVSNAGDCDDGDGTVWPGADDVCDGVDNDCSGTADDDPTHFVQAFLDRDGDGSGDPGTPVLGCGGVRNDDDCDDNNPRAPAWVGPTTGTRMDGSADYPYPGLQIALERSTAACFRVRPGTYVGALNPRGRHAVISSTDGAEATFLVGDGTGPVLTVESGENVQLEGFTLSGGTGKVEVSSWTDGSQTTHYGGGVYIARSTLTLTDIIVRDNVLPRLSQYGERGEHTVYGNGGGIYATSGTLWLRGVTLAHNEAHIAAALYAEYGLVILRGVEARGNRGTYANLALFENDLDVEDLVLNGERPDLDYGGVYLAGGRGTLANLTAVDSFKAVYVAYGTYDVVNGIFADNDVGVQVEEGNVTVRWSDFYANGTDTSFGAAAGSDGNLGVDPGFVRWTRDDTVDDDDFALQASSPLRDAGDPSRVDWTDGSRSDMGARSVRP